MKTLPSRSILAAAAAAVLASLAVVALPLPARAVPILSTVVINDWTFTYDEANPAAGATISAYSGTATSLTLPPGITVANVHYDVTAIGEGAFGSLDLTAVTLPATVTSIGLGAFLLNSLTSVSIPASVTTIGDYAFAHNSLTSVTIPGTVTDLGDWVFMNNQITSFTLPPGITTIPMGTFTNNQLTSATIPASVTFLGGWAFAGNALESVLMEGPVPTSIGNLAFESCGGATVVVSYYARYPGYTQPTWTVGGVELASQALVAVTLDLGIGGADTVTSAVMGVGMAAPAAPTAARMRFVGWSFTDGAGPALTFPLVLDDDATLYALWESRAVTSPATAVAGDSFSLTGSGFEPGETVEVLLGSDPVPLTTMTASGTGTISGTPLVPSDTAAGLYALLVTGTVTGTTSYDITVEVVPAGPVAPTYVAGPFTFEYDPDAPETGATLVGYDNSSPNVSIPSSVVIDSVTYEVTAIGELAFQEMGLTSVTIPETVTSIGAGAFLLNSLTSVALPDGLAYLGPVAFAENQLASITIPDSLTTLDLFVFQSNSLTSVTLPETLTSIYEGAFNDNHLTSITIPALVTTIFNEAFAMNPLESVFMKGRVPGRVGTAVFGAGGGATPVVTYYARYPGYTQPTWTVRTDVYASQALVSATFGTGGTVTDAVLGSSLDAPAAPTAEGKRFLGWSLTDGSGPVVEFPLLLDNDSTLYALWEARAVTSPAKAGAGDSFAITGSGFEPGESVEVWLHSDPVLLTTLTASGTGTISASLLLASGTPAGAHQLVFTGTTTGTTANDILVEGVLAASGFDAEALTWLAILLIVAGAGLRLFVTVRRMRVVAH